MFYLDFFDRLHAVLDPETYLEIGVREGASLALARHRAVGIDPAFAVTAELDGDVALVRTTSDEFFARSDPLHHTRGRPFDLAFIDGLHLFEFALRDFLHVERHSAPHSVVVLDDVLPRSVDEAARVRRGPGAWTGDVYGILEVLAEYRPDLTAVAVDTRPTGLLMILGLDPRSTVLADHYDEIMRRFRRPDPQPVPPHILERLGVLPAERVLRCPLWPALRTAARSGGLDPDAVRAEVRRCFGPPDAGPAAQPRSATVALSAAEFLAKSNSHPDLNA